MIVEVNALTKTYRIPVHDPNRPVTSLFYPRYEQKCVLAGLSFSIEKGSIVGYIGPNGSGKSTTIKILTGILSPSSGHVRVCGFDPVPQRQSLARHIGVVFGNRTQLLWDISVRETLSLYAELYQIDPVQARNRIADLVEMVELTSFQHQTPRTLSLGQRIRADIAVALVHSPELVILDEPTIGLDTLLKIKLRNVLKTINSASGTTILLTTHDMNDIEALCSRVLVLHRGSLAFDGTVEDIKRWVSRETEIRLRFSRMTAHDSVALFPKDLVEVVVISPTETRVRYRESVITTSRVLQMATQAPALENLSILSPTIEEIVAALYSETGDKS